MRPTATFSLTALLCLFAVSAEARAQPVEPGSVEVSVSFGLMVPTKSSDLADQKAALEDGRRALYEMASKECDNLLATIASSCELRRLNVQSSSQRMATQEVAQLNANASYRIVVKAKP